MLWVRSEEGQERLSFADEALAEEACDQRIWTALEQGYRLIEAEARADPEELLVRAEDPQAYLVYADQLLEKNDPRGELIALQAQAMLLAPEAAARRAELEQRARNLLRDRSEDFCGGFEPLLKRGLSLHWHLGFVRRAELELPQRTLVPKPQGGTLWWLKSFLQHPSSRFLRGLKITYESYGALLDPWVEVITDAPQDNLQSLEITAKGNATATINNGARLLQSLGALRQLTLEAERLNLGPASCSELVVLTVLGGLEGARLGALAQTRWPQLLELDLVLGEHDDPQWAQALIEGAASFPALKTLRLRRTSHTDELCAMLASSALLDRLETLELSEGEITDHGAGLLAERLRKPSSLKWLSVAGNGRPLRGRSQRLRERITDKGLAALRASSCRLIV